MANGFNMELAAQILSKKLGVDKSAVVNGDTEALLSKLSAADKEKIQSLMTDKKEVERLLKSKKAQDLLNGLLDNKNG